jgi:pSer/pThr/pTyr-binding forkhead associated (FHA) protein
MGCLCCGKEPAEIGALCRSCAKEVSPCEGLIPDHIHSRIDSTDAEAWVVDGFGGAYPIAARSRIGRSQDSELIVLASSVSREHAELQHADAGWVVTDLASRNGTLVQGVRVQGSAPLPERAVLRVGDVALWFLAIEMVHEPTRQPTMTTDGLQGGLGMAQGTPARPAPLIRYQLVRGDKELCIVATGNGASAGALLWRVVGTDSWSERSLAPLEFQLLRALCIRAHEEATSPSTIRGCVPTKQLVSDLPFQSKYANQENVRQVVLRLRGVLAEVGVGGLLAVAPGRGYYLASPVSVGDTSLPEQRRC